MRVGSVARLSQPALDPDSHGICEKGVSPACRLPLGHLDMLRAVRAHREHDAAEQKIRRVLHADEGHGTGCDHRVIQIGGVLSRRAEDDHLWEKVFDSTNSVNAVG
jgi:hypothetical protein